MKKFTRILLFTLSLIVLAGCGAAQSTADPNTGKAAAPPKVSVIQKVTPAEGKALLESGQDIKLIDVRSADEYKNGHIAKAVNIPLPEVPEKVQAAFPDKTAPIMVYCHSGRRSAEAAARLEAAGYTKIYDLGGIKDWPYEVTTAS